MYDCLLSFASLLYGIYRDLRTQKKLILLVYLPVVPHLYISIEKYRQIKNTFDDRTSFRRIFTFPVTNNIGKVGSARNFGFRCSEGRYLGR